MCESNQWQQNQKTTIIITTKLNNNMKEEEKKREKKTQNIVYPYRSNNVLFMRREQLFVPLIKTVTLHKDSKRNYKNQSSNFIRLFSQISSRVQETQFV